jgi:hypothetical protein
LDNELFEPDMLRTSVRSDGGEVDHPLFLTGAAPLGNSLVNVMERARDDQGDAGHAVGRLGSYLVRGDLIEVRKSVEDGSLLVG